MIRMNQTIILGSRTGRGSLWLTTAEINGVAYQARHRNGAPQALARALVEAGIPDQRVEVVTDGIKGVTSYRSLHAMALRTMEESATIPLHSTWWRPWPSDINSGRARTGKKQGGSDKDGG